MAEQARNLQCGRDVPADLSHQLIVVLTSIKELNEALIKVHQDAIDRLSGEISNRTKLFNDGVALLRGLQSFSWGSFKTFEN